jgi:hypothetical protein
MAAVRLVRLFVRAYVVCGGSMQHPELIRARAAFGALGGGGT